MAIPNYFTCTLGQAASLNLTNRDFKNINTFIDSRAESRPTSPVVGFAVPNTQDRDQPWAKAIYTFSDIAKGSCSIATYLRRENSQQLPRSKTVALICPSTPKFLFTWLALMRLGHAVLLIAPQCQPAAIAHLCNSCDATLLYYDEVYETQAKDAAKAGGEISSLEAVVLPSESDFNKLLLNSTTDEDLPLSNLKPSDVAYLHHTSGTSSGVPKPIAQTHHAGAGVLPCFPDGHNAATFTTTPLYHGGVADLFRAWSSGALIWLFPGKGVPITASNIVKCLDVATQCSERDSTPPVRYFSSVPYVLQSMEADERGLQLLQGMDIVGVGGAALPAEVGDRLVSQGVNLISRFGSAECGFLMSSHRVYDKDKEWQYLRSDQSSDLLAFEKQQDDQGLCELVISKDWPHMAKRNRDDGSFGTADLFAAHDHIKQAWRYHSRADSQLTLITGKKFDPAPLEGAIAASDLLDDVLIFGNGQPFPGALLFRSEGARQMSDADLVDKLWPTIDKLNGESQDHARLPRKMLVPMAVLDKPIEKSSKGTIIRGATESRFATVIDGAYVSMMGSVVNVDSDVPDDQVLPVLTNIIESVVATRNSNKTNVKLKPGADLFNFGVDSVAGIQVRYGLRQLLPRDDEDGASNDHHATKSKQVKQKLPLNIVEDCGTVARLAEYVIKQRHGQEFARDNNDADEHKLMLELVEKYSRFVTSSSSSNVEIGSESDRAILANGNGKVVLDLEQSSHTEGKGESGKAESIRNRNPDDRRKVELDDLPNNEGQKPDNDVVLLTGVTGALGAHLLDLYASSSNVAKVYCLVRGANTRAAEERVSKALARRGLRPLDQQKVIVLCAQLGEPCLGLSDTRYDQLRREVSIILHVAWTVNFRMRLRSFEKDNIAGVTNLVNLALQSKNKSVPRFGFCSSVASVLDYSGDVIPEKIVDDPSAATALGYSRSKWVAEQICCRASTQPALSGKVRVFRIGQLSGDKHRGVWNTSEAWPIMLSSVKLTRTLPDLEDEVLDWLPVDVAAEGLLQAMAREDQPPSGGLTDVLHILNDKSRPDWGQLLLWLRKRVKFEIVSPTKWVSQLEKEQHLIKETDHPAFKLLGHWKRAYGEVGSADSSVASGEEIVGSSQPKAKTARSKCFEMIKTHREVPALRSVAEVDEAYFVLIWRWIDSNM